jgi:hypothetical protein
MTPAPVLTSSLPELLASLDRLDLNPAVRTLARDIATVCDQEGLPVGVEQVLQAAQGQLNPSQALRPYASAQLVPPYANRPATAESWKSQIVARQKQKQRRRRIWKVCLGIAGVSFLPAFVFAPLGGVVMVALLMAGIFAMVSQETTTYWLDPFVPTEEQWESWQQSPLARIYLRLYTEGGVPLHPLDIDTLDKLTEEHKACVRTLRKIQAASVL